MASAPTHPPIARLMGIFTPRADVADAFVRTHGGRAAADATPPCVMRAQSSQGHVAIVARGTAHIPVECAERGDGSFAAVDGQFFGGDAPHDAAGILDAYIAGDTHVFARLNGAGTITLWDAAEQRLLVVRDWAGLTPAFWTQAGETLYWSTDLAALVPLASDRSVRPEALDYFMSAGFIPSPWTLVRGVHRLSPGSLLSARAPDTAGVVPYHQFSAHPKRPMTREQRSDRFGEVLETAIARQYDPARKTAALMSGGIDSTLMTAILANRLGAPVDTYTFHYLEYEGWKNEVAAARKAAQHFGVPHHEIEVGPGDVADRMGALVGQYGEPFAFGLHSFKLDAIAEDGAEVLFSGQGAGWYNRRAERLGLRYAALPAPLRRLLRSAPGLVGLVLPETGARIASIMDTPRDLAEHLLRQNLADAPTRAALLPGIDAVEAREAALAVHRELILDTVAESPLDRITIALERLNAEHHEQWNHRWSRANDLLIQHPYHDRDLIDLAFHFEHPDLGKGYQRRFAETLMPRDIAYAPKLHQHAPVIEWLRAGPLADFVRDQLTEQRLRDSGLFDPAVVRHLLDVHTAGTGNHAWALWGVLATLMWQEQVLAAAPVAVHAV